MQQKNKNHLNNTFPKNTNGFSLVELMFAMLFLSVIVFGVVRLQLSNLVLSNTQNNLIQAHFWANQGAEIVAGIGSDHLNFTGCTGNQAPCDMKLELSGSQYQLVDMANADDKEDLDSTFSRFFIVTQPAAISPSYAIRSIIEWTDSTGNHVYSADENAEGGFVEAKRIVQ